MLDPRKLDLNALAVFEAIHRERSVTGAARRLGLTQPTVSFALNRLRRQFDDPLFVRSSRGMVPTPLADELAPAVHDVLETVRRRIVERRSLDPGRIERTLRLCMTDANGLVLLPRLLRHLQQRAPSWRIESVSLPAPQLAAALEAGEVDLGLGNYRTLGAGFYKQRLMPIAYGVIFRKDHPRLAAPLTLGEYVDARHAVMKVPGAGSSIVEDRLAALGLRRDVAITVSHFTLLPALVARTDLVATVPAPVADYFARPHGLVATALPLDVPPLVISQYWHHRYDSDPVHRWVRQLLVAAFQTSTPEPEAEALMD